MKKALLLLVLIAPSCLWAQVSLTTTTLSQAVNGSLPNSSNVGSVQTYVYLTSLTNVKANSGSIRTVLYVDREMMAVDTVSAGTNQVTVLRGYNGTLQSPHASGATVFVGSPDQFYSFDPAGACNAPLTKVTPWINYLDSNQWTCTAGAWTLSGGPFFSVSVVSFPVVTPQTVNSGGAITPSGTGQINAIGDWYNFAPAGLAPAVPTLTTALTGGTLTPATSVYVRLTFVGLSTTLPSPEALIQLNSTTGCGSGSTCSITITMPTPCTAGNLPAGVSGCTVWDGTVLDQEKQQTASAACVNITTATCVVGTLATGSNLSATLSPTSGILPSPFISSTTTPDFIIPLSFVQKANGYYPISGIDTSALNFISCCWTSFAVTPPTRDTTNVGTFTWMDRFFINDDVNPPPISNTLMSIKHESGASTSTLTTSGASGLDDRALTIRIDNDLTSNPFYEQYLTQYNEDFVDNNNTTCSPVSGGTPWGESCTAGGRFITTDQRTAGANVMIMVGAAGVASTNSAAPKVGGSTYAVAGVQGGAYEAVNNTNGNAGLWVGGVFGANGVSGNTNGNGAGVMAVNPTVRFATTNIGFYSQNFGTNAADWDLFTLGGSGGAGKVLFQGTTYVGNGLGSAQTTIPVTGSFSAGGYGATQLSAPTINSLTNIGAAGAQNYTAKVTCVDVNGAETVASASNNIGTANGNLTASTGVNVNLNSQLLGCTKYNVYRTVYAGTCNGGACTNGLIGSIVPALANQLGNDAAIFADTGQVGDGNTSVAQPNTTGGATLTGLERDAGTCRIGSDVALTVNTANSFCTFNLPSLAQTWAYRCDILWAITAGTGTNNFALGVNVQQTPTSATNAAATIYTTTTGTQTSNAAAISASGATNVLTGATYTPAATVLQAAITGTLNASASAGTFAITATANGTTATAAVKAGTSCRLF